MNYVFLDSVTDVRTEDQGKIGICGSHGGLYAGAYASRAKLRAVVLNDAGVGLHNAGTAGVSALDGIGMAGLTVSADSARIGSSKETLEHGIISYVNSHADALGLAVGQSLKSFVHLLNDAPVPTGLLDPVEESKIEEDLTDTLTVLLVDSAALIRRSDKGRVIITGSHGGLIGGDPNRACKADAKLVVFNDAGGGKDGIGYSRLPVLDDRNIAAVTVDCHSCRIGDAHSTLDQGVISRVNAEASKMGFRAGNRLCKEIVEKILGA